MKAILLGVGVLAWTFVLLDFVLAFRRRRSQVRFVFCVMAMGWPLWLLRELKFLSSDLAWPLALLGICSGMWCAYLLLVRWLNDPRVLD